MDRLAIMVKLNEGRLTQREAAATPRRSERQVRRMYKAYKEHGAAGLTSKRCGKPSRRRQLVAAAHGGIREAAGAIYQSALSK